jgi:hypothetical protein
MLRFLGGTLVPLAGLLLMGCAATSGPTDGPSSSAIPTEVASPTPTPAPEPTASPTATPTPDPTPSPTLASIDLSAELRYPKSQYDLGTLLGTMGLRVSGDRGAITRFSFEVAFSDEVPRDAIACGQVTFFSGGFSVERNWSISADRGFSVAAHVCKETGCPADVAKQDPVIAARGRFNASYTRAEGTWECSVVGGDSKGAPLVFEVI